jgi:hypothetical protein
MKYPLALRATATETIRLLDGGHLELPKATPCFKPWTGPPIADDYGGKQVLDFQGRPLFAELVILRLFQAEGWDGVWIDTYRRRRLVDLAVLGELPADREELLRTIAMNAGTRGGCFDVYAWRAGQVAFAESKRSRRDRIRPTQKRWISGALAASILLGSLLIVEWSLTEASRRARSGSILCGHDG